MNHSLRALATRASALGLIATLASGCWLVVDDFKDGDSPTGTGGASGSGGSSGTGGTAGCVAQEVRCEGNILQTCTGGTFKNTQDCQTGVCSVSARACLACNPGQGIACEGQNGHVICEDSGLTTRTKPCEKDTPVCIGAGQCVQCRDDSDCVQDDSDQCGSVTCTTAHLCQRTPFAPGSPTKDQDTTGCSTSTCNASGKPESTFADANTACTKDGTAGICTGTGLCGECIPSSKTGKLECTSTNSARRCDDTGHWTAPVACLLETPACSGAGCVGVTAMCASPNHTCAVLASGEVRCWGDINYGQTGHGFLFGLGDDLTPKRVDMSKLSAVPATDVVCGIEHSCLLDQEGSVYCWGSNHEGQLGTGQTAPDYDAFLPTKVTGSTLFTKIVTHRRHTCGISKDGGVFCWGDNRKRQVTSTVALDAVNAPTAVMLDASTPLTDVKSISVGNAHSCALQNGGKIYCWGDDSLGQLGDSGATKTPGFPREVTGLSPIAAVFAWGDEQVALEADMSTSQRLWGWGRDATSTPSPNSFKGTFLESIFPVSVVLGNGESSEATRIIAFLSPGTQSFSILGTNDGGMWGNGSTTMSGFGFTHQITGLAGAVMGSAHVCTWTSSGRAQCWGSNSDGELGVGSKDKKLAPTDIQW